jgi:Tol biopolymer transport system component
VGLFYLIKWARFTLTKTIWPRLSADGQTMAYIQVDSDSLKRSLHIADADGANARLLVAADAFEDVDAPLFSPDDLWVYFGAVPAAQPAGLTWFDRLLGVKSAAAHDVPSDWWRIPLAGGAPEQITSIRAIGMYGDFVANGRYMAFAAQTGLYLMNPDGTNLTSISWKRRPPVAWPGLHNRAKK